MYLFVQEFNIKQFKQKNRLNKLLQKPIIQPNGEEQL